MECLSQRFVAMMDALLGSEKTVLASVAMKPEGFIQLVKKSPDCRVVTVSIENRGRLAEMLLPDLLRAQKPGLREIEWTKGCNSTALVARGVMCGSPLFVWGSIGFGEAINQVSSLSEARPFAWVRLSSKLPRLTLAL